MKGFFYFLGCATIAFFCNSAMAKNKIDFCNLVVYEEKFFAMFPIINEKRHVWEWGIGANSKTISYSWIVELGYKEDNEFKKFDYAMAVTSLIGFGEKSSQKEISLASLISDFSLGIVYLNSNDAEEREKAHQSLQDMVIMRLVHEDHLILYSKQKHIRDLLFSNRPTHALLTASLSPYPDESYSCLTEIIYD